MRIFTTALIWPALLILLMTAPPATAGVELQETSGSIVQWVLYHGHHGPCSLMQWTHEPDQGIGFEFQTSGSGEDYCTESAWGLACDEGGLSYLGSHLLDDSAYLNFTVSVEARIEAVLDVTSPAILTAHRQVEGILGPQDHTVTVEGPDGSSQILLGADPQVVSGEMALEVGTYRVILSANALESVPAPFSYTGTVEVTWSGPVASETRAWDQLKTLYR